MCSLTSPIELADLLLQPFPEPLFLERVLDDVQKRIVVPWLLEIVIEPDLVDGFDGVLLVRVTGQEKSCRVRLKLPDFLEELDSVHLGHQEIRNDDVDRRPFDLFDRFSRVGGLVDLIVGLKGEHSP